MIQLRRIEQIRDVQLGAQVMILFNDVELLLGISAMPIGHFKMRGFKYECTYYQMAEVKYFH